MTVHGLLGITGNTALCLLCRSRHKRHTFGTHLYKASGGNLRLVQKQLGHSRITTTQVYADVFAEDAVAAVERLYRT